MVQNPQSTPPGSHNAIVSASSSVAANPLDQLSSADIAVHIARMTGLPESTEVVNQADSANAQLAISSSDDSVIAKPQVVATALKSRKDIQTYTTVAGDTLASIAVKFGVTSDSIKWSNDLSSATIQPNQKLAIPPVNGIVYTVKTGDTPDKLAVQYNTNKDLIITTNDAEVGGLKVGERILIPDGTKSTPTYVAAPAYNSGLAWGTTAIYGYNGYPFGFCTWYAATQAGAASNWGNANTWAAGARASGWTVTTTPRPGAIAQRGGGLGHVGIVEAVSEDGTMMKFSDMNGIAGWGRVGYSDWVSIRTFQYYIYR